MTLVTPPGTAPVTMKTYPKILILTKWTKTCSKNHLPTLRFCIALACSHKGGFGRRRDAFSRIQRRAWIAQRLRRRKTSRYRTQHVICFETLTRKWVCGSSERLIDYNCGWSFYVSCYKWLHLYVLLPLNELLFDIWNLVSNCEYYEKPLFYSALILKTTLLLNLSTRQLVKVKKKVKYSIFNALFSDLQFKVFKS